MIVNVTRFKQRVLAGWTNQELARTYLVTPSTICYYKRKFGVRFDSGNRANPELSLDTLAYYLDSGWRQHEVAAAHGITQQAVSNRAVRSNMGWKEAAATIRRRKYRK